MPELQNRPSITIPFEIGKKPFSFRYDLKIFKLILELNSALGSLDDLFSKMSDYSKKSWFMMRASEESFLLIEPQLRQEEGAEKGFSSIVESYKKVFEGLSRTPKTANDVRGLYESFSFSFKNDESFHSIDRFHLFRTAPLLEESFIGGLGLENEIEIIKAVDLSLSFLNDIELDFYSRSALFFFIFLSTEPFYALNLSFSTYLLGLGYFNCLGSIVSFYLAKTIFKFQKELRKKLLFCHQEDSGDITSFVEFFLIALKDGSLSGTLDLKNRLFSLEEHLTKKKGRFSKSDTILYRHLAEENTFRGRGVSIYEMIEETGVSFPTANRFIKKMRERSFVRKKKEGKIDRLFLK